jgi:hypothetical protein
MDAERTNQLNKQLLARLEMDLTQNKGTPFEKFVASFLTRKFGPTLWAPENGKDGGIDFASKEILFQIYGGESPGGDIDYVREKLKDIDTMWKTAKENKLTGSHIVFLTNIHPTAKMTNLFGKHESDKVTIKSCSQTARFLYDVYYPYPELQEYFKEKSSTISGRWPYDISEESFVDNFDYLHGRRVIHAECTSGECLKFLYKAVLHGPVICSGFYGMGKTTISKIFFKKWAPEPIYPIFIELANKKIEMFEGDDLSKQIVEEIKQCLTQSKSQHSNALLSLDDESFTKNLARMLQFRKLAIILDGIDESNCSAVTLKSFVDYLFKNKFLVLLTCRREFTPFFDAFQAIGGDGKSHTYLELRDWKSPQWVKYREGILSKQPDKEKEIGVFFEKVEAQKFLDLPNRPLFLKMLCDLEINNKTSIRILDGLSGNLSEIYYKFITWKISDDHGRKAGVFGLDNRLFEKECFELLLAVAEQNYTSKATAQTTLGDIEKICAAKGFLVIKPSIVAEVMLNSSLFAILKRGTDESFTFSHKSFMEYMVAFSLASCVFNSDKPENANCSEIWKVFQTHEVSQHFIKESERLKFTMKLTPEKFNLRAASAFKKVIGEQKNNLLNYDERLQEVLYYIGKLRIHSDELTQVLQDIVANRQKYNPVYFRSASLALSVIKDKKYCEEYVLFLIDDLKTEGEASKKNDIIQKQYYGESELKQILKKDIDEQYLLKKNLSSIISLKIWSYFRTIPPEKNAVANLKKYLRKIKQVAIEKQDTNIETICHAIEQFLDSIEARPEESKVKS